MTCSAVNFFPRGIFCPPLVYATKDSLSERGDAEGGQANQQSFSKVTEVKNDSLLKEPWKQGLFDSTIANQRRGRDSNPRSSF